MRDNSTCVIGDIVDRRAARRWAIASLDLLESLAGVGPEFTLRDIRALLVEEDWGGGDVRGEDDNNQRNGKAGHASAAASKRSGVPPNFRGRKRNHAKAAVAVVDSSTADVGNDSDAATANSGAGNENDKGCPAKRPRLTTACASEVVIEGEVTGNSNSRVNKATPVVDDRRGTISPPESVSPETLTFDDSPAKKNLAPTAAEDTMEKDMEARSRQLAEVLRQREDFERKITIFKQNMEETEAQQLAILKYESENCATTKRHQMKTKQLLTDSASRGENNVPVEVMHEVRHRHFLEMRGVNNRLKVLGGNFLTDIAVTASLMKAEADAVKLYLKEENQRANERSARTKGPRPEKSRLEKNARAEDTDNAQFRKVATTANKIGEMVNSNPHYWKRSSEPAEYGRHRDNSTAAAVDVTGTNESDNVWATVPSPPERSEVDLELDFMAIATLDDRITQGLEEAKWKGNAFDLCDSDKEEFNVKSVDEQRFPDQSRTRFIGTGRTCRTFPPP